MGSNPTLRKFFAFNNSDIYWLIEFRRNDFTITPKEFNIYHLYVIKPFLIFSNDLINIDMHHFLSNSIEYKFLVIIINIFVDNKLYLF